MPEPVQHQQTIVGDSGPLIAFAIVGQLELLPRLYRRVIVPQTVWDEVTVRGAGLPGASEVSRITWAEIQHADPQRVLSLAILVDRGEAEAIALAMDLPGSTVLLDDALARRVAERFGVERIGTLGVLRRAKKAGLLAAIKPLVEQLQASGIFMRPSLVETVLRDVGELL
jgi:uncharacterized protein